MWSSQRVIGIALITVSVVLAIVAYWVLPDVLVVQLTADGAAGNRLPKLLGLLIPMALTTIGAILYMNADIRNKSKYLALSLLGLAVWVFLFVMNLRA